LRQPTLCTVGRAKAPIAFDSTPGDPGDARRSQVEHKSKSIEADDQAGGSVPSWREAAVGRTSARVRRTSRCGADKEHSRFKRPSSFTESRLQAKTPITSVASTISTYTPAIPYTRGPGTNAAGIQACLSKARPSAIPDQARYPCAGCGFSMIDATNTAVFGLTVPAHRSLHGVIHLAWSRWIFDLCSGLRSTCAGTKTRASAKLRAML